MSGGGWTLAMFSAVILASSPMPAVGQTVSAPKLLGKVIVSPVHRPYRSRIVAGRLSNGVRFAIFPRRSNEPGVGLLMRNEGGFIAERRPGERGLAHLIEHLFLVSPTVSAPDDVGHFSRIGLPLTFPAPSAGTTSWRETNYFVSTRTTQPADLDTLMTLLREVTTDLTFRPDAVDDQRADVMREMAGRKEGNDVYARFIAAVAPGSPGDVIDAQNSDDVPTASVETIRAFYHHLYRPETMMLVIVGDVDPLQMEALIRRRFGGWKAPSPIRVSQPVPTFQADRIAPISYSGDSQGRRVAMITVTSRTSPPASTRRTRARAMLMEMLALRAISNRLAAAQPGAPPGKIGVHVENGEEGHRLIMLWDNFAADGWRQAIAGLRATTCDLETGGFDVQEWERAKQDVISDLKQRTSTMGSVPNVELAKDLSHAIAAGRDLILPNELLGIAAGYLRTISARAGTRWWQDQWQAGVEHIRVEEPELSRLKNAVADIRAAADQAAQQAVCKVRTD